MELDRREVGPSSGRGLLEEDGLVHFRDAWKSGRGAGQRTYVVYIRSMQYSWYHENADKKVRMHGIAFDDAVRIFEGRTHVRIDNRFDYAETRCYAIGLVDGRPITVIYADDAV